MKKSIYSSIFLLTTVLFITNSFAITAPSASVAGIKNSSQYYLILSQTLASSNANCKDATNQVLLPESPPQTGGEQWVSINAANGWIDLEYNVCANVSYDAHHTAQCQNYLGHIGVSFAASNTVISNVDGGKAQLGPYVKDKALSLTFTPNSQPVPPAPYPKPANYSSLPYRGINLSGAEFDSGFNPPNLYDALYFVQMGMNTVRVPFKWEYIQSADNLSKPIDFTQGNAKILADLVDGYTQKGLFVILDMHNYMRYPYAADGKSYPVIDKGSQAKKADFAYFWGQMANHFANNKQVIFDLMNEPYNTDTESILANYNAAIAAIRTTEANNKVANPHLILLEGNGWSGLHAWTQNYYGTPNAEVFVTNKIIDPKANYAINVHQYFDKDNGWSGLGECSQSPSTLLNDMNFQAFINYMNANKLTVFVSELGGLNNTFCGADIDTFLTGINLHAFPDNNGGGFIGWTGWAAGQAYGNDPLNLAPTLKDGKLDEKIQVTSGFKRHVLPPQ